MAQFTAAQALALLEVGENGAVAALAPGKKKKKSPGASLCWRKSRQEVSAQEV